MGKIIWGLYLNLFGSNVTKKSYYPSCLLCNLSLVVEVDLM